MSEQLLKVGLLGCGKIAALVHIPILRAMPSLHLTALAEPDADLADQATAAVGDVECFDDWQQLLDRTQIDAVIITLPTPLHAQAAKAAFERGLHVYIEKPLGVSCAETLQTLHAWRESGKLGVIGFNFRFNPLYESVRQLIHQGQIGKILSTQTIFTSQEGALPGWKQHRQSGGGTLLDLTSHHFDLLPWLLDRQPLSVACKLNSRQTEEDTSSVQLTFEGGLVSHIFTSIAATQEHRLEVIGSKGTLLVDLNRSDQVEIRGATLEQARLRKLMVAATDFFSPAYWAKKMKPGVTEISFERCLNSFIQAAGDGRQVQPDLFDGYRALALVEAAEESARKGCSVGIIPGTDENITA